jgi:lipopolysaccharide transport system ATP-binding protein
MTDCTVRCEGIGKRYRIGQLSGYTTLREYLADRASAVLRGRNPLWNRGEARHIWAIRNICLEARAGEAVGIIGRNGSGKTTLLKVLSRVTIPTEGRALVRGRVGSLLEVGTGFHPELTGRENIYLSGAIIGMKRREIDRKFDQIVAFSGVERFLDTPLKRYSSGMHVRLGFSVSAHLEPEILFIDEVLAVGDVAFQRRCREKIHSVSESGGTILFVSHNMSAVRSVCKRTILLDSGRIQADGRTEDVLTEYLTGGARMPETGDIPEGIYRVGTGSAKLKCVSLLDSSGRSVSQLRIGQPFRVEITVDVLEPVNDGVMEIDISSLDGVYGATAFSSDPDQRMVKLTPGQWKLTADLSVSLLPGRYTLDLGLHHNGPPYTIDFVHRTLDFDVINVGENGASPYPFNIKRGFVRPESSWHDAVRSET